MAYTYDQLVQAYTALHVGLAPDATTAASLDMALGLNGAGQLTDAQLISNLVNSADSTTALAVLTYQFFTGKSPSAAGLTYLVNSAVNTADLNDLYYSKFSLENRYINFAANLGIQGEGAANFAAKYASLSYSDYVASIYQTIIGASYATAAGIDPAAAIASIISRKDAILATAQGAGMIPANATAAQIDIALKAATAGYLLGEAIKADVGLYAAAADNFMLALATGTAVYNTDITVSYKPTNDTGAHGTGHAVDRGPDLPVATTPPVTAPTGPAAFVLTPDNDQLSGGGFPDTFTGTDLTFNAGDSLNGGAGADVLTITAAVGGTYTAPSAARLRNIETVNISNTNGVTVDASGWTDVTQLNVTSRGAGDVRAAATTDITVNGGGNGTTHVDGGHNVTLNFTNFNGALYVGGLYATPTGALTVNITNAVYGGPMNTFHADGDITVIQTATNSVGSSIALPQVNAVGGAATHTITVRNTPTQVADFAHAGVYPGEVDVSDQNAGSNTPAVLTTADIDGFSTVKVYDTGLTTLRLARGNGDVELHNTGSSSPATTLNLSLNAVAISTLTDYAAAYTTLNVTTGAIASSLFFLHDTGLTTLNIGGASQLTINDTTGARLQGVTITDSAGLIADLTQSGTVTSVDTSASTGTSTITINPGLASYTGGAGVDNVTLSTTSVGHALSLGGGDDSVTLASGTVLPSSTIDGGTGTDTLVMRAADAATASGSSAFAAKVINFEHLKLTNFGGQTINLAQLGGYNYVAAAGQSGLVYLNGFTSGGTLELIGAGTGNYNIGNANFGGAHDVFNIKVSDGTGTSIRFDTSILLLGVETVNIVSSDTQATPSGNVWNIVSLTAPDAQTITLSGNAGVKLGGTYSSALTTIDASGLTAGGLYIAPGFLHGLTGDALTIKGGATTYNPVSTVGLGLSSLTYVGGSGVDVVEVDSGGANSIDVGSGADQVIFDTVGAHSLTTFSTITGMSLGTGDSIRFSLTATSDLTTHIVTGQNSLQAYLNAAAAGDGSTQAHLSAFQYGGDTYLVVDRSAGATFVDGSDFVVKLAGVTGDLSHLTFDGQMLNLLR